MNKNMKFKLLVIAFLAVFSSLNGEQSLLSDSDSEIHAELILEAEDEKGLVFRISDLAFSCSQINERVNFLDIEEQSEFLSGFSEWKLIYEILQSSRISGSIEKRSANIKRAIAVVSNINVKATESILLGQVNEAVNNGEVRYVSQIIGFINREKKSFNISATQWDGLFESGAIFNFVKAGPSLHLHNLLGNYEDHLIKTKKKSKIDNNYIDLIKKWTIEDVFLTENRLKRVMKINK